MGTKQLVVLVLILAVVSGAAVLVRLTRSTGLEASMSGVGEKVLENFPINGVSLVSFRGVGEELTLRRAEEGETNRWVVEELEDYPAEFGKVISFLREMWELEVAQVLEAGPSQYGQLRLLAPGGEGTEKKTAGTLVEFRRGEGEVVASLILGKEYERQSERASPFGGSSEPAGRYLRAVDGEEVWLVAETLESVELDATSWMDKNFFKVEKLRSIERRSKSEKDDWKLARTSVEDDWELLFKKPGEELDESKVGLLTSAFSGPRFDEIVVGGKSVGDGGMDFILETLDGFQYTVSVGKELEDRKYHLMVAVEAELATEREAEEGESEEEKKKRDEEFAMRQEELKKKLAVEKGFEGRVYVVPNFVVSSLIKKRYEILKGEEEENQENEGVKVQAKTTAVTAPNEVDLSGENPGTEDAAVEKAGAETGGE